jgi:hypothetical protein
VHALDVLAFEGSRLEIRVRPGRYCELDRLATRSHRVPACSTMRVTSDCRT